MAFSSRNYDQIRVSHSDFKNDLRENLVGEWGGGSTVHEELPFRRFGTFDLTP